MGDLYSAFLHEHSLSRRVIGAVYMVEYSGDMVDWSQCPEVESDPERVHGAWVFKNTRLPIAIVFECLAKGATIGDIIEWYGGVTKAQIEHVVSFVADSLQEPAHAHSV